MKIKIFFILSTSVCLFSCDNNLPTRNVRRPYIIKYITEWTETNCRYSMCTRPEHVDFNNEISVIDSIGKFSIGDTVVLSLEKY